MTQDSVSPDSSWESEFPPAELVDTGPLDKTEIINPPPNTCPKCSEAIIREPGTRGRLPKYHVECRPSPKSSSESKPRVYRVSKQEQQVADDVERIIEQARKGLAKVVALISLADPYDALVLHVNAADLLDNLRSVVMRYEWARNTATVTSTGGSLFGLVIAVFTTVLPIASHHGLIPSKKVSQILLNVPMFMLRLQQRLAESDDGAMTDELLKRVTEEGKRATETRMRQQTMETQSNGGPS